MFASLDIHYNNSLNNTEVHKQNETKIKKTSNKKSWLNKFRDLLQPIFPKDISFPKFSVKARYEKF